MPNLNTTIQSLAAKFASELVVALRGLSLDEILAVGAGKSTPAPRAARATTAAKPAAKSVAAKAPKSRIRRSLADIEGVTSQIVALLKKNPKGLRAEQIQAALKLAKNESPRPLAHGLAKKTLKKQGKKRSTTYFAA